MLWTAPTIFELYIGRTRNLCSSSVNDDSCRSPAESAHIHGKRTGTTGVYRDSGGSVDLPADVIETGDQNCGPVPGGKFSLLPVVWGQRCDGKDQGRLWEENFDGRAFPVTTKHRRREVKMKGKVELTALPAKSFSCVTFLSGMQTTRSVESGY